MNALDNLMEYRNNPEKYLPLIDHDSKFFPSREETDDVNIGWDCGFIGKRPYFLECWATDGITMITIFLSTTGIEDYSIADLEKLMIEEGKIYTPKEGYESPDFVPRTVDSNGNEFFSINIVVGLEDEPERIGGGGRLVPFSALNELNGFSDEDEEEDDDEIDIDAMIEAADNGDEEALHGFVTLCYETNEKDLPEDIKELFFKYLYKLAEDKDIISLIYLGEMFENGRFVEADIQKAIDYYQKAGEVGEQYGYECIGSMYFNGVGIPADYEKAYEYFMKVEKPSEMEYYMLGEMHRMGLFVEENQKKAVQYYEKAVERGTFADELGMYAYFAKERLNGNYGELDEDNIPE